MTWCVNLAETTDGAVRTGECCAERLKHKLWAVTLSFPPGTDTATKWMPRRISCNKMGYFHQGSFRILIRRCLLHESAGNLRIESKARQSHYHTSCQRQDDFGYRDTTAKPSLKIQGKKIRTSHPNGSHISELEKFQTDDKRSTLVLREVRTHGAEGVVDGVRFGPSRVTLSMGKYARGRRR